MNPFRAFPVVLFCCAAPVSAQIATVPQPLARASMPCVSATPVCDTVPQILSRHAAVGDSATLHRFAWEVLQTLATDAPPGIRTALGDLNRNYYRLVWVDDEYSAGEPEVRTLLIHGRELPASAPSLPGISDADDSGPQLIDVFVTDDPDAVLKTQYLSTAVDDPDRGDIPAFVQASGIVGFMAGLTGRPRGAAVPAETTFSIARARLPFARANVTIRDSVVIPGSAVSLRSAAVQLRDAVSIREALGSPCARSLAAAQAAAIAEGVGGGACSAAPDGPRGLSAREAEACRDELVARLDESYRKSAAACPASDSAVAPMLAVDAKFAELVRSLRQTLRTATVEFVNLPQPRYSFGLLSGVILAQPVYFGSAVRARVGDAGTIVQDPLPAALNMAVVNIHPRAEDPGARGIRWRERFRFFAGTAVTPDFGVGGGAGIAIMRGLSVNAGWALLFTSVPGSGVALGDSAGPDSDPLRIGLASVFFTGLSYSFK